MAEPVTMVILVTAGDLKLFVGHVYAHHFTLLAHQGGKQIHIAAGATAQIQDAHAVELLRSHQAAAVVAGDDFVVKLGQQGFQVFRRFLVAAGIGLQIVAGL